MGVISIKDKMTQQEKNAIYNSNTAFMADGNINTSDGTAVATDVLKDKVAYSNGVRLVGTMAEKFGETIVPSTSDKVIAQGQYLKGNQIIKGDANLVASNIKNGVTLFQGTPNYIVGTFQGGTPINNQSKTVTPSTSQQNVSYDNGYTGLNNVTVNAIPSQFKDTTETVSPAGEYDITTGKKAFVNGAQVVGKHTCSTGKPEQTKAIKPIFEGSQAEVIVTPDSGKTLSEVKILRDDWLINSCIKSGTIINGITGTFTSDGNITSDKVANGYVGYANGQRVVGQASLLNSYTSSNTAVPAVNALDTWDCTVSVNNLNFRPKAICMDVRINGRSQGSSKLVAVDFGGFSHSNHLTDGEVLVNSGCSINNNGFSWTVAMYNTQIDGATVYWSAIG